MCECVFVFMFVCMFQYVGGMLWSGFTSVCQYNMCICAALYIYICMYMWVPGCACLCVRVCMYVCVCVSCGGVGLCVATVCHISHGVLSAGPSDGPLRFMECHSVASAVNQVNVADPISSVVLRSRWKNNIWTAWFGPGERLMPV